MENVLWCCLAILVVSFLFSLHDQKQSSIAGHLEKGTPRRDWGGNLIKVDYHLYAP
jgi:hypothetical protein